MFTIMQHGNTTSFSGIYLFDVKTPGSTSFYCNNGFRYCNGGAKYCQTVDIPEGNVIIFPSELLHYVTRTEQRTTFSFNVNPAFCTMSTGLNFGLKKIARS